MTKDLLKHVNYKFYTITQPFLNPRAHKIKLLLQFIDIYPWDEYEIQLLFFTLIFKSCFPLSHILMNMHSKSHPIKCKQLNFHNRRKTVCFHRNQTIASANQISLPKKLNDVSSVFLGSLILIENGLQSQRQKERDRAKNPCFLLRLMTLGWYVLLGNKSIGSVDESPAKHAQGRAVTAKGRPDFYQERNRSKREKLWHIIKQLAGTQKVKLFLEEEKNP